MQPVDLFSTGSAREPERSSESSNAELGRQDFLRMLIAQLENQDPLNPQDPTEFTAQLAQFSTLEQLISIRGGMDALASRDAAEQTLSLANLIGREVVAESDRFALQGSGAPAPPLELELAAASPSTEITVTDDAGRALRTLRVGPLAAGRHAIDWDGRDAAGRPLPAGVYGVRIRAGGAGSDVPATPLTRGVVSGSTLRDGSPALLLGGVPVPLDSVLEVHAAGSQP